MRPSKCTGYLAILKVLASLCGAATLDVATAAAPTISAGGDHACVVTASGGVKCWGTRYDATDGFDIQDLTMDRPQDVPGLSGGIQMVAEGQYHRCALTVAGAVLCWGYNFYGQLGDGTTVNRDTPALVSGLSSGVTFLVAGVNHNCALLSTGPLKCWGQNTSGQLGDGGSTSASTPITVPGLAAGVTSIAAGGISTCAVVTGSALKCWGGSRVGDGTTTVRRTPTDVVGLGSGVQGVAVSSSLKCAIVTGGGLKCWGVNTYGSVGDGTTTDRLVPVDVLGMATGVSAVSVSNAPAVCAIVTGGAVNCWGRNPYGAVGNGTVANASSPVPVIGLDAGVIQLVSGTWFSCALTVGGAVRCWGDNRWGQLGDRQAGWRPSPRDVPGLGNQAADLQLGGFFACARTLVGGVKCWGANRVGSVGDGTSITSRPNPVDVLGLSSGVATLGAGLSHSCAVTTAGAALCWGENASGQLGDGSTTVRLSPTAVDGLSSGVARIAGGAYHGCAVLTSGGVKCWGGGSFPSAPAYLGDGTTNQRLTPVDVNGLSGGVDLIGAGSSFTCVKTNGGGVKCWGSNTYGEVGDGSTTARLVPVDVFGLTSGVVSIAVGYSSACVLTDLAGVKCWGYNGRGQLGDGTTVNRPLPADVPSLTSGVAQISAGADHFCALLIAGTVKCWGTNYSGHLGDGTLTTRLAPVDVVGLRAPVTRIAAGATSTCALLTDASVQCWGDNQVGQVGDGTVGFRTTASVYVAAPSFSQPLAVADRATVTASLDGAIIARYLAGFSGNGLLQNLDLSGSLRSDSAEISRYLEMIRPLMDVDGNGTYSPLSDGLLLMRYLLGVRGDALVAGALGAGATRQSASAVEAYLAGILP